MSDEYFVGHGIVYAAQIDGSGNPEGFIDLGNSPDFTLSPGTRGNRNVTNPADLGKMLQKGEVGKIQLTLDTLNKSNLAQAFYGSQIPITGATEPSEDITVKKGRFVPVANINISNLSMSSGAIEGTDYTVDVAGGVHFLSDAPNVNEDEVVQVSYDYTDHNVMASFSLAPEIQWVRFNGINIVDDNNPVVVDIYKVRFTPIGNIPLIGEAFVSVVLNGTILYDSTKAGDTTWGNYFRIRSI